MKAVLFDLDGTLLPMDQDVFNKAYFGALSKKLAPRGYEPKSFIDSVWAGVIAMLRNDGKYTNEQVFWRTFAGLLGDRVLADKNTSTSFIASISIILNRRAGLIPKRARL